MATRGRPPRKRSPRAGNAVGVKGHTRSPRGSNYAKGKRKPVVRVDGYKRKKAAR